jgi:hypothetical protein
LYKQNLTTDLKKIMPKYSLSLCICTCPIYKSTECKHRPSQEGDQFATKFMIEHVPHLIEAAHKQDDMIGTIYHILSNTLRNASIMSYQSHDIEDNLLNFANEGTHTI